MGIAGGGLAHIVININKYICLYSPTGYHRLIDLLTRKYTGLHSMDEA